MSVLKFLVLVSLLSLIFMSCVGIRPCINEQRKKDRRMQAEGGFDPWNLERENPIIIQEEESTETQGEFSGTVWQEDETGAAKADYETLYRIQIFASKFPEEAENFMAFLQLNFDQPVNIDYEAPYYKVRLGDFETLKEANSFLKRIRQKGFPQAWVIKIKKEEKKEDDRD